MFINLSNTAARVLICLSPGEAESFVECVEYLQSVFGLYWKATRKSLILFLGHPAMSRLLKRDMSVLEVGDAPKTFILFIQRKEFVQCLPTDICSSTKPTSDIFNLPRSLELGRPTSGKLTALGYISAIRIAFEMIDLYPFLFFCNPRRVWILSRCTVSIYLCLIRSSLEPLMITSWAALLLLFCWEWLDMISFRCLAFIHFRKIFWGVFENNRANVSKNEAS